MKMISRFESFLGISPPPTIGSGGFAYERFPTGVKLGSPRARRIDVSHDKHSNTTDQSSSRVKLPKLVFDNTPLPPRRNTNCSYISNHKTYLRLKGFRLSDVYSLNRHKINKPNISKKASGSSNKSKNKDYEQINIGSTECITSLFHPDRYTEFYSKKKFKRENTSDVWKPYDPKTCRDPYYRSLKELDEEIPIPGHVPRVDIHQKRLGRVITTERMRELLSEEEPIIPRAFYSLDAAGILSPRYDL